MKLNFKDLYKSANNNLSGNKELIGIIFEKAESKKSFFALYYKQVSVCAAAALLILTMGILPFSSNYGTKTAKNQYLKADVKTKNNNTGLSKNDSSAVPSLEEMSPEAESTKSTSDIHVSSDKNNHAETRKNKETKVSLSDGNYEKSHVLTDDSNYDVTSKKSEPAFDNPLPSEESKEAEDKNEDVISSGGFDDNLPMIASAKSSSVNTGENDSSQKAYSGGASSGGSSVSGGGGGGGGGRSLRSATLTIEEYFGYLGLDINSFAWSLPPDMEFNIPENIEVTTDYNNNYLNDYARFIALDNKNPDKILSVHTTKIDGEAKNALESDYYEIKIINNHKVAINNNPSGNEAYFNLNNVWFSVTSANISPEDFNNFVFSLLN